MTISKTLRTLHAAGTSISAGGSSNGTAVDLRTCGPGSVLTIKITNGATGPTVACSAYIEISGDNTNWKTWAQLTASTANSATAEWCPELPFGVMYVRVRFADNTGQAVTVEAFLQEVTSPS